MLRASISGASRLAAVVGRPVAHSLSPLIHNAWLNAAGIDGVYMALEVAPGRLAALMEGLRSGGLRGFNVTLPFKAEALEAADTASDAARAAGAANLILFDENAGARADNTDGLGLLKAFRLQAPGFRPAAGPVVILGAGGAARGAAAALLAAGSPEVRLINRTAAKAEAIGRVLGSAISIFEWSRAATALHGATAVINATSLGLQGMPSLDLALDGLLPDAVVMDMVYRPLITPLLAAARAAGHPTVDGLEMLIQQAIPSFTALFGQPPPSSVDVRGLALGVLEARR